MDNDLTQEQMQAIISNISGNSNPQSVAQPNSKLQGVMKQINLMSGFMNYLEQGMSAITTDMLSMKFFMDFVRHVFITKGILTEEEFDTLFEERVANPTRTKIEEVNRKIKESSEQQIRQVAKKKEINLRGEEERQEEESNVVLASERFKK